MADGELALVLHTHMPYVEGFGTWPFGEEWLWEAIATSYLPLLEVLEREPAPVTLSLTPVLCDQLEAPGAVERCIAFLEEIRPESHRLDAEELSEDPVFVAELERSAAEYARAARRLSELRRAGGLLTALGSHASWTSAATHAVLPLLASDTGVALQVQTGIASHRRRFGEWDGGLWLPECAHAPWLNPMLEEAGVRSACIELTGALGLGDARQLRPIATADGPALWPIDRQTIALAWSANGYPASPAYRDYHHLTPRHHRLWSNSGAAYDHDRALEQAAADAIDFVERTRRRVADGGVCVCALDTELLGHWWYEGVDWLAAVLEESRRQGLALTTLDDALERHPPQSPPGELEEVTSWGAGGDLRTWSAPGVADLAWQARTAELRVLGATTGPSPRALRELLALQSSYWGFLATHELAGDYPRERAAAHAVELERALADPASADPALRNLAPDLTGWVP
jgi:1,4-alpha-glucan branching enzyme